VIEDTIYSTGIAELARVEPFDRLEKGPFPESKYSISISLIYQSSERTLTDDEVDTFDRRIVDLLASRVGAQLRN
jgi:phenylalanyl-tRNA synthetase beta subunit